MQCKNRRTLEVAIFTRLTVYSLRSICEEAREAVRADTTVVTLSTNAPMSRSYIAHYSFDYAQQVSHYNYPLIVLFHV